MDYSRLRSAGDLAAFRDRAGDRKYLICNADEGDPGAFMDRALLEGAPHQVIEGMIIGAYAIGASHGFIYVRAEYPMAVEHSQLALEQARACGLLGEGILGSSFSFDMEVRMGAGAFVCGEESALIASLEGHRGMPRPRPPFPVQKGYLGRPTTINNVETFGNVPLIVEKGKDWFAAIGTPGSKGTKVFALAGKVRQTGLVEVPMGITLREMVFRIGGGIPHGRAFKAAQMGGPSGGCVPAEFLDLPIDYDSVRQVGAIMGSGGLIVMDERTCMVDTAQSRADDPALLPRRVRGAHPPQAVPRVGLWGPDTLPHPRGPVHRLRRVSKGVPRPSHHRRKETGSCDRSQQVCQVRPLQGTVQVRRRPCRVAVLLRRP